MSFFDIWFTSARYDGTTARRCNPFTGEMIDVPQTVPLAAPRVDAVREALTQAGAIPQGAAGNYRLVTADGALAEIDAKNLSAGCRFAVRGVGVTPQLGKLAFPTSSSSASGCSSSVMTLTRPSSLTRLTFRTRPPAGCRETRWS